MTESYEAILKRMLDRVPDDVDKREGSVIYMALAPAAWEVYEAQLQRQSAIDLLMVDTSIGDYLTRVCAQYGVNRKLETQSLRKGVFTNTENAPFNVPVDTRFGIDGLVYKVVEKLEDGQYELICEYYGSVGNKSFGSLLPLEYMEGLATATLGDVITPGEDTESDEDLRSKYYASVSEQAFGGNIADYKNKCRDIPIVGGVKVDPVWAGGGTVKLVVIDNDYDVPTAEEIDEIQTIFDPKETPGKGLGLAPIGHVVTVEPCTGKVINVSATITLQEGFIWSSEVVPQIDGSATYVKDQARQALEGYLLELRKSWDKTEGVTQNLMVRSSKVENILLDVVGVLNVENVKLNSMSGNLTLLSTEVPVLGEVSNNEV